MQIKLHETSRVPEASNNYDPGYYNGPITYDVFSITQDGKDVDNSIRDNKFTSAGALYNALYKFCGKDCSTFKVVSAEMSSPIEGQLALECTASDNTTWVFSIGVTLEFTDPIAVSLSKLDLTYSGQYD